MLEMLLIASCVTNFSDGTIINIEGICAQPQPAVVQTQNQLRSQTQKETDEEFFSRQNQPGSELNQLYLKTYIETFCDPSIRNLKIWDRMQLASDKANAITSQWNSWNFMFMVDLDMVSRLSNYKCQ